MPTYNAEEYVAEAIESVLKQSFPDFEFIIVDDGSTDKTLSIIRSYEDERIKLIENNHDFIGSLNIGLTSATGKYIVRMDADDIMHTDRLKIQYAIMEEEPTVAVCSSWMTPFGKDIPKDSIAQTAFGMLENPLLLMLKGNMIFHPTVMMRTSFLRTYNLQYENYECAEDYKLWTETAKKGGVFYVESQPLLFYRISNQQVSTQKKDRQENTSMRIRKEVLDYLLETNDSKYPSCKKILETLLCAKNEELITDNEIFEFFFTLFAKNKNNVITG
jgi:glycosyltransferase involved in cell wall biosynthesis